MPEFLTNTDFYFSKDNTALEMTEEELEKISDSEMVGGTNSQEIEAKQHEKTVRSLKVMLIQMKAMNGVLGKVH
jgi:hypothetical protein